MIDYIKIQNFKSLKNASFSFKNLNLLMGLNSMGKSSVIQSMLLMRQSFYRNNTLKHLYINGDLVSLGNSSDVFFQNADFGDPISITINGDYATASVDYMYSPNVDSLNCDQPSLFNVADLSLFSNRFCYLSAEHIPPAKTYSTSNVTNNEINPIGNRGENAALFLSRLGGSKIRNNLLHHKEAKSDLISHELDAWVGEISPGIKFFAEELNDLDMIKMSIQYETAYSSILKNGEKKKTVEYTNSFSPVNVGFGIPYVFPLVLSLLIRDVNDLLIIENPESHLHPKGQAALGTLIALAAQSGVQIICETHSDHILNGIRVAVKDEKIDEGKVGLFYFDKNKQTRLETEIIPIHLDRNGELDSYPIGLLDEWGDLMARLF